MRGFGKLVENNELDRTWANRRQHFQWVNDIYYYYGPRERKKQILHVVVCEESWEEVDQKSAEIVTNRKHPGTDQLLVYGFCILLHTALLYR